LLRICTISFWTSSIHLPSSQPTSLTPILKIILIFQVAVCQTSRFCFPCPSYMSSPL
jgi:hypothetical protein